MCLTAQTCTVGWALGFLARRPSNCKHGGSSGMVTFPQIVFLKNMRHDNQPLMRIFTLRDTGLDLKTNAADLLYGKELKEVTFTPRTTNKIDSRVCVDGRCWKESVNTGEILFNIFILFTQRQREHS